MPSPASSVPRPSSKARSTGSVPYPSYWQPLNRNINKLGNVILPGRKSSDSDLTKESLEAHDRRQAAVAAFIGDKNVRCSPYYKGLTDQSLAIGRVRNPSSSPGRESHALTMASSSSSSSFSSFIARMHGWSSSCLIFKTTTTTTITTNTTTNTVSTTTATAKASTIRRTRASSSSLSLASSAVDSTTKSATSASFERKEISDLNAFLITCKEKPLRERTSVQPPPPQQPAAVSKDIKTNNSMNENEFIWAKKYRPQALTDFICNRKKAIKLQEMLRDGGCGHFVFEGPPGVGKRTMILAMLREVYGADGVQTREERKGFQLKGESIGCLYVNVKESFHHLEISLHDIKDYEKHVIVELIRGSDGKISDASLPGTPDNCRAIILYEADKLSTDALLYLKWLFERFNKGCNKVFFCCSDASKLQPIRPLCNLVQLSPPSKEEVVEVLEFIANKEGIDLPHQMAENIADSSKKNLRQAIRSFEATWRTSYPFKEDQEILTGWEADIANIAKNIVEEQTPRQLYDIRVKLRHLTEHDVSAGFLFKTLVGELKKLLPEHLRHLVDMLYEDYNRDDAGMFDREKPLLIARNRQEETGRRLNNDTRRNKVHQFLRIEEFVAKFMSWWKMSITNNKSMHHDSSS